MSWQTYVDEHLMCDIEGQGGLKLAAAAILGHDGAVWAQSATFPQVHICCFLIYADLCRQNTCVYGDGGPMVKTPCLRSIGHGF